MTIAELSDSLLSWVLIYGPIVLFIALFLGAIGVPIPGTFMVIASGAFVRQGALNLYSAITLALLGAMLGDTIIYGVGRFARTPIKQRFGQSTSWQKAETTFVRWGGLAIYLTRWLFTPIAVPTNLVAGSGGYPFWKFVLYDLSGEITWLILFGGLGYAFSSQWEALSQLISDFSGVIIGLAVIGVGVFFLLRPKNQREQSRRLV